MINMRETIIVALKKKLEGDIAVSKANIESMLDNTVGVAEHPGIVETVEAEVEKIAHAEDKLEAIKTHFKEG